MNRIEAKTAIAQGKVITHEYFTDEEFVKLAADGVNYEFKDKVEYPPAEFWMYRSAKQFNEGWKEWIPAPKFKCPITVYFKNTKITFKLLQAKYYNSDMVKNYSGIWAHIGWRYECEGAEGLWYFEWQFEEIK